MIIDVSDILKIEGSSKNFSGDLILDSIDYQGEEISFPFSFYVAGMLVNNGEVIILTANAKGKVILQCGTCLEYYEKEVEFSFDAKCKQHPDEDEPDVYVYNNDKIDIKDMVMENFLLNLPITRKCNENCKGICPGCGVNLNKEKCRCGEEHDSESNQDEIDSRLAVLENFFSDDNEEV